MSPLEKLVNFYGESVTFQINWIFKSDNEIFASIEVLVNFLF